MRTLLTLIAILALSIVAGCATTEFKPFETKTNAFEGRGGTKVIVDVTCFFDI